MAALFKAGVASRWWQRWSRLGRSPGGGSGVQGWGGVVVVAAVFQAGAASTWLVNWDPINWDPFNREINRIPINRTPIN